MDADQVKNALRARYPATAVMGVRGIPGPWTVLEELWGVDLLAMSSWSRPKVQGVSYKYTYPIVGHEVKVSRSDLRRELLRPDKRSLMVERTNQSYLAVPKGLLSDDELGFREPVDWDASSFDRPRCQARCRRPLGRGKSRVLARDGHSIVCDECKGKGTAGRSRVELEAPTLWVPPDLGLIEVDGGGCRVTKRAPVTGVNAERTFTQAELTSLVRWISVRPDPRHAALR